MAMNEIEITQKTYLALADAVVEHAKDRDYIAHTFSAWQDEANLRVTLHAIPHKDTSGGLVRLSVVWWESYVFVGADDCINDFSMGELINTIFGA